MPSFIGKLKNMAIKKLHLGPNTSTDRIQRPTRDRDRDNGWEDFYDGRDHHHANSYTSRREFNLPGGIKLAITNDRISPRNSRDRISWNSDPRSSRDCTSIYDPKRSRDRFSFPQFSRDSRSKSQDGSRGRQRDIEGRRSGDGHRRRRRKSSHPIELSRHRSSNTRVDEGTSVQPLPPLSLGGMFGGLRISGERANNLGSRQLEADMDRLHRQQQEMQKQFDDEQKHQRGLAREKELKAKDAAKAAERQARKQAEEDTAKNRRERELREKKHTERQERAQLRSVQLTATKDNTSDSGDSAKSELNRGVGNMQRTIIEGMLPAEEVLKEERRRREDAVRQRGPRKST